MTVALLAAPEFQWSECGKYYYDHRVADAACGFFPKYLKLTKGEWSGKPFHLEAWQRDDIIAPTFGWMRRDGTRRYRRVVVWVPRKNGKTELAAGVALLMLMADGEGGSEVYSIAKDKRQATIVFEASTAMAAMSPPLSEKLELLKTSIYCPELNGSFQPLTGNAKGKHGLNASGLIGDEVHEWPDAELYTFVHQSSGARRQPLEFLISTAGVQDGYGYELWQECQAILSGDVIDDETLVVIYAADEKDDWGSPETWQKANPNYGITIKPTFMESEYNAARQSPRKENAFKNYYLNLWTEQAVRWLPMDKWGPEATRWADADFEQDLIGQECFAGIDLSSTTDLSALCLLFPPNEKRLQWRKLTRVYMPEDNVALAIRRDKAPYDRWIASGAMQTTPGNVIDYNFIQADLEKDAERFNINWIGVDPYNATQFAINCMAIGLPIEKVRQGFLTLNAPSKEYERLILNGGLDHGGHPVARWCASNAAVRTDEADNIKPVRPKQAGKRIDTVAADVNALAGWMANKVTAASPWDDPDFSMGIN